MAKMWQMYQMHRTWYRYKIAAAAKAHRRISGQINMEGNGRVMAYLVKELTVDEVELPSVKQSMHMGQSTDIRSEFEHYKYTYFPLRKIVGEV